MAPRLINAKVETKIRGQLDKLAVEVERRLNEGLRTGQLRPVSLSRSQRKIEKYDETEGGPVVLSSSFDDVAQTSWILAATQGLQGLEQSKILQLAAKGIHPFLENPLSAPSILNRIAYSYALLFLEGGDKGSLRKHLRHKTNLLLNLLKNEPVPLRAISNVNGFSVSSRSIELNDEFRIVLRQPTLGDLASDNRLQFSSIPPFDLDPTLILELTLPDSKPNIAQIELHKFLLFLRLFAVSSVHALSTEFKSESLSSNSGGFSTSSNEFLDPPFKFHLAEEYVPRLRKSWKKIFPLLESDFTKPFKERELVIASHRYNDAVLTRITSSERRIADAVMGLESLYLRDSEDQELSFKLSTRLAAVFEILGGDGIAHGELAQLAYSARSRYVHGSDMNRKMLNKINNVHGGLANFVLKVLDQLRVSMIFFLLAKESKDELLKKIDESFIRPSAQSTLRNLARDAISLELVRK